MGCSSESGIDLHIHSNASDGTLSPSEIINLAVQIGLKAISITDHDTVQGAKKALESNIPNTIEFLPGIEMSTAPPPEYPCKGSFHVLGYGLRMDDPDLNREICFLQKARKDRIPEILRGLNRLGLDISLEEVHEKMGNRQVGRPHVAEMLVEKGYAESVDDAFDKFLGIGKPGYVKKRKIGCGRAIEIIRNAGGRAVLAHPGLLIPKTDQPLDHLIRVLKNLGLSGIEVIYPEHSPEMIRFFSSLADQFNLLTTGGTDFHGAIKPEIKLGSGTGNLFVPYFLFLKLKSILS